MPGEPLTIEYRFRFPEGAEKHFVVRLRPDDLALYPVARADWPAWTQLGFHQCENCPLAPAQSPRCPIAANLVDLIEFFREVLSYAQAEVTVVTPRRTFRQCVPAATGVGSLLGLYMVVSGCPVMDKLRPMAYTHLPFASAEETLYRALSMYLLGQFFRARHGATPDWAMRGLVTIYDEITKVNIGIAARLRSFCERDASLNALVKLDCFAATAATSVAENSLDDLERLFHAYLDSP